MKTAVVYVGNFFFPDGNASGKRVFGNLKAIQDAGYIPYAIGFHKENEGGRHSTVEGIESYSIQYCTGSKRLNNRKPLRYFFDVMKKISLENEVKIVVMYGSLGTTAFNKNVIRYCKKNNIIVLYDLVDMFNKPSRNNLLRYFIKKKELYELEHRVIKQCDGGIGISSYIQRTVFSGMKSIVVPPLAVRVETPILRKETTPITIAYATYMSDKNRPVDEWKDRVDTMIDLGVSLLHSNKTNFRFKFIGFTEKNLIDMFVDSEKEKYRNNIHELYRNIEFLGPCSNENAQEEIRKSDFTILLRDRKTSTNAGFPTKVSESLSLGVPVLANITSDLGKYIKNGENGFILQAPEDIQKNVEILQNILVMNRDQINGMKLSTAKECKFIYTEYTPKFKSYFQQLIEGK